MPTSPRHAALAAEGWGERVVPTFRPDAMFYPDRAGWAGDIRSLSAASGIEVVELHELSRCAPPAPRGLRRRGRAGRATTVTCSADTTPLPAAEAQRIFDEALNGPGRRRDAHPPSPRTCSSRRRGCRSTTASSCSCIPECCATTPPPCWRASAQNQGFDIPATVEFTRALRPLLEAFGHDPRFRMILFTVDETVYSRELAPIAGAYPSVRLGAPWWFLDSPDGMARFRELTTETAGFYNTSGFVDDTRAFASIPARHDLARRIDAGFLAKLVAEHRLGHRRGDRDGHRPQL